MGPGGILPFGNGPKSNDFAQFSPGPECLYSSIRDHEETLRASVAGLWLQIPNQRTEDFGGAWPTPILVAMAVPVSRLLPSVGHRSATLLLGEQELQSKA